MQLTIPPAAGGGSSISGLTTGQTVVAASPTTIATDGIKRYAALFTQTGTNAPVVTELQNTVGAIVWTRDGAGQYIGTLVGAFPVDKLSRRSGFIDAMDAGRVYGVERLNDDSILLRTLDSVGGAPDDGFLDHTYIEFVVYP